MPPMWLWRSRYSNLYITFDVVLIRLFLALYIIINKLLITSINFQSQKVQTAIRTGLVSRILLVNSMKKRSIVHLRENLAMDGKLSGEPLRIMLIKKIKQQKYALNVAVKKKVT